MKRFLLLVPLAISLAGCGESAYEQEVRHWRQVVADHVSQKSSFEALQKAMEGKRVEGVAKATFVGYTVSRYEDDDQHCILVAQFGFNKQSQVAGGHLQTQCEFKPL